MNISIADKCKVACLLTTLHALAYEVRLALSSGVESRLPLIYQLHP